MTIDQISNLLQGGWPVIVTILGWVASHYATKATFDARIRALEAENLRFRQDDYLPHKAAVEKQHETIYGKIDAIGHQLNEIAKAVTEVRTIVTMMNMPDHR